MAVMRQQSFRERLTGVLQEQGLAPERVKDAVDQVLETLTSAESLNELADTIEGSLSAAHRAWAERDDIFFDPRSSRATAEIAVHAVATRLKSERVSADEVDPRLAFHVLSQMTYKDWEFSLVRTGPDLLAVRVSAVLTDTCRDEREFRTTRYASIGDDGVVAAALRAVLKLEAHEAREHLRVKGSRVVDPHADSYEPLNRKPPLER